MKYFIITVAIIILGYIGWHVIQTKPSASVPQAVVTTESTQPTTSEPMPQTSTTTINTKQDTTKVPSTTGEIDNKKVSISFKGFGPGKVHEGSIGKVDSKLTLNEKGELSGIVTADLTTLSTGNAMLDKHLNSKDFFDTTKYKTALFTVDSFTITDPTKSAQIVGSFTIKGITKKATLPVKFGTYKKTCDDLSPEAQSFTTCSGKTLTSNFTLDLKDFGINNTFANSVIELTITVPLK